MDETANVDRAVTDEYGASGRKRPARMAAASYGSDTLKLMADPSEDSDGIRLQARCAFRFADLATVPDAIDFPDSQAVVCHRCGWFGIGDHLDGQDVPGRSDPVASCPGCDRVGGLEARDGCRYCGNPRCLQGFDFACDGMREAILDDALGSWE